LNWPRSPTIAWVSSVQTPVALTTCFARISKCSSFSMSCAFTPTTRSPTLTNPTTFTRLATWAP
jgi:hypothetical protein